MTKPIDQFFISQLSLAERLQIIALLWDSMADQVDEAPLTPEQSAELDRRVAASERGEINFSPWEEVKLRLLSLK